MEKQPKTFIWQMIKEAVEAQGNRSTNVAVRDWIGEHYPGTGVNTVLNQIIMCTVNHHSRIHYHENNRPRRCSDAYDFLFRPSPGKLEMYDPRLHGEWEIAQDEKGVLVVREVKENHEIKKCEASIGNGNIDPDHLRSYLAKNLELIEEGLELYVDLFGNDGVNYPTDFGQIDILAMDRCGALVVAEVIAEGDPDISSGQILKHRNWVKRHLAFGKPVRSYIIGHEIPDHVRYSLADFRDVFLREYDLSIHLREIPGIADLDISGGHIDTESNDDAQLQSGTIRVLERSA